MTDFWFDLASDEFRLRLVMLQAIPETGVLE